MGAFCEEARKQCDILQNMFKNMEKLYCDLESYYVFDKQKYTLEEFMSDVKAFKDQFKVSPVLTGVLGGSSNPHIFSFFAGGSQQNNKGARGAGKTGTRQRSA